MPQTFHVISYWTVSILLSFYANIILISALSVIIFVVRGKNQPIITSCVFIFRTNPSIVVACDKGLTFSPAESVFICQKKNHFQVHNISRNQALASSLSQIFPIITQSCLLSSSLIFFSYFLSRFWCILLDLIVKYHKSNFSRNLLNSIIPSSALFGISIIFFILFYLFSSDFFLLQIPSKNSWLFHRNTMFKIYNSCLSYFISNALSPDFSPW